MEIFESTGNGKSKLIFMYIYGGAFCNQFSKFHWKFLADIAEQTGCSFTTLITHWLPNKHGKEEHSMVIDYYKEFIKTHNMNKAIIRGDIAGSGFVLSLLQQVIELKFTTSNILF